MRSCVGRLTGSVSQRKEKPGDANGPILGHFILSQFRKGVSSSEGERAHLVSKLQGNTDDETQLDGGDSIKRKDVGEAQYQESKT